MSTLRAGSIETRKFAIPIVDDRNVQLALQSEHQLIRALMAQIMLLAAHPFPVILRLTVDASIVGEKVTAKRG